MRRLAVLGIMLTTTFCASRVPPHVPANSTSADLSELWVEPVDLESRDLFYGPGGRRLAPDPSERFEIVAEDKTGYSGGYDVRDRDGRLWSVKIGREAQPEVAVSRILWAIGYHQPPMYLMVDWNADAPKAKTAGAARFRPHTEEQTVAGEWSWYENPFVTTQPFRGLIVANVLLNNWDWKTSNNKIYEVRAGSDEPRHEYVVRDLGASLGKTKVPPTLRWARVEDFSQGSRNDLEDFEKQGFIKRVKGDRVAFVYKGIHPDLVKLITADDLQWACMLMDRLSDEQLLQAFRAAGYPPEYQERYARRIREKIREGRALAHN